MPLVELKWVLSFYMVHVLLLRVAGQGVNHLFDMLWVGKNFQASESWILEHVLVRKSFTFEYFLIHLLSI